ncbi:MAG: D-alanyl-D-alanine carboxypeptidase [Rhodospirillales bacterium]|nr:D-alanyl-D-alanine carboxypeptidase [Rhodospirillales bacterium]
MPAKHAHHHRHRNLLTGLAFLLAWLLAAPPAAAIETIAKQAILVEVTTGEVLFEKNADQLMAPASMSKMMTAYMVFERLKNGGLSLDDTFPVSEDAWRRGGAKSGGSTMFLEPGKRVRVEDLIRGIVVQSGNDACIVVAEALASSEKAFAEEMTKKGRELGLKNTVFKNASGWPDPEEVTTARDLALLAERTIEKFPDYYHYYAEKEFTYNGIRQINRNPLLYKDMAADGLKTGHTEASGYGLTASAVRDGRRLILVVNGLDSKKDRAREPERLMAWGFREFNNYRLFSAGDEVTKADVWLGEEKKVSLVIEKQLLITMPRNARPEMKVTVHFDNPVPAPIANGAVVARLVVTTPGRASVEVPLKAGAEVKRLGLFGRLGAAFKAILWGQSG